MTVRPCIICGAPSIRGRSRCGTHGPTSPKGPTPYDSHHKKLAADTVAKATHCAICGLPPTPTDPLHADHIVPLSMGGTNTPDNLQAAHRTCNIRKGGANRKRKP